MTQLPETANQNCYCVVCRQTVQDGNLKSLPCLCAMLVTPRIKKFVFTETVAGATSERYRFVDI